MSSSSPFSVAIGLLLVVVAGVLNGSWNAAFCPGICIGKQQQQQQQQQVPDLDHALAWTLFQTYAALINIPICLAWVGGTSRAAWIVEQASAWDIGAVTLFSLLWAVGSIGFGMACQIAGVGLGTNLTMGVIMILGTLLPLLLDGLLAESAAGAVILVGLAICCLGLFCSMSSLKTRDADETVSIQITNEVSVGSNNSSAAKSTNDKSTTTGWIEKKEPSANKACDPTDIATTADDTAGPDINNTGNALCKTERQYTTTQKVIVCIVAGVFASQLQFAFVFGRNLIDLAESSDGPGSPTTSSGTSAIVWLFAISVSAPVSIFYGLATTRAPLSNIWKCPWYRHVAILLGTSFPWVTHIHLYGYSNSTLPEAIAASISWPILMMLTVTTSMVWSILLGEWKQASRLAYRQLGAGLALITVGVAVLMSSVAV